MDIIVRGDSRQIDFVRAICREKCRRGELRLILTAPSADYESAELRRRLDDVTKENETLRERVAELEGQLNTMDDVKDDKTSADEDIKFIDLDADDKTPEITDSKDVTEDDSKEPESPKKSKKSKKSK